MNKIISTTTEVNKNLPSSIAYANKVKNQPKCYAQISFNTGFVYSVFTYSITLVKFPHKVLIGAVDKVGFL